MKKGLFFTVLFVSISLFSADDRTREQKTNEDRLNDFKEFASHLGRAKGATGIYIPIMYIVFREVSRNQKAISVDSLLQFDSSKLRDRNQVSLLYNLKKGIGQQRAADDMKKRVQDARLYNQWMPETIRGPGIAIGGQPLQITEYGGRKVITYIAPALLGKDITIKFIANSYIPIGDRAFIKGNIIKTIRSNGGSQEIVEYILYPIEITSTIDHEGSTLYTITQM